MMRKMKKPEENKKRIRINTSISGIYAEILNEVKNRGIARSNTDAVCQGLLALRDKILESDLAIARLKQLKESNKYSENYR